MSDLMDSARENALIEVEDLSDTSTKHLAYRYLYLEKRISATGGWANFRDYIVNKKDIKQMEGLKDKIDRQAKEIESARAIIEAYYDVHDCGNPHLYKKTIQWLKDNKVKDE